MDIEYLKRQSKFLAPCEAAIRGQRGQLDSGGTVRVVFEDSGGFDDEVAVTVRDGDRSSFGSNWEAQDPTWFPARIKAAASALLNCGYVGSFLIGHDDGALTIRQG